MGIYIFYSFNSFFNFINALYLAFMVNLICDNLTNYKNLMIVLQVKTKTKGKHDNTYIKNDGKARRFSSYFN